MPTVKIHLFNLVTLFICVGCLLLTLYEWRELFAAVVWLTRLFAAVDVCEWLGCLLLMLFKWLGCLLLLLILCEWLGCLLLTFVYDSIVCCWRCVNDSVVCCWRCMNDLVVCCWLCVQWLGCSMLLLMLYGHLRCRRLHHTRRWRFSVGVEVPDLYGQIQ